MADVALKELRNRTGVETHLMREGEAGAQFVQKAYVSRLRPGYTRRRWGAERQQLVAAWQKQNEAAGGEVPVAPLEIQAPELAEQPEGAACYRRRYYECSLAECVETKLALGDQDLRHIVAQICGGLLAIRARSGRSHGNLCLENVLIDGARYGKDRIFLTDLSPATAGSASDETQKDLQCLGWIIYQLVRTEAIPMKEFQGRATISLQAAGDTTWFSREQAASPLKAAQVNWWSELCTRLHSPADQPVSLKRLYEETKSDSDPPIEELEEGAGVREPAKPPELALTAPAQGANYQEPATISLAASVKVNGHTIQEVQFFEGQNLLGAAATEPYRLVWKPRAGSYNLRARIRYDSGSFVWSDGAGVTVSAPAPLEPPEIVLSAPGRGMNYQEPAVISLAADVKANGHTIQEVEFYEGQTLLGTAATEPYRFTWKARAGTFNISARLKYDAGKFLSSKPTSVVVNRPAAAPPVGLPEIALSAPVAGSSFQEPSTISLDASVKANGHTLQEVQFFEGQTLLGAVAAEPYRLTWKVRAGSFTFSARIKYDSGNYVTSDPAGVTVNPPRPQGPPEVALTAPTPGAKYQEPATINLVADVKAKGHSIKEVQFYEGERLLGVAGIEPYRFSLKEARAGAYSFSARVRYDADEAVSSGAVSVSVSRPVPAIALTASARGKAPATITLAASVEARSHKIQEVQFFEGEMLLGAATTQPYSFTLEDAEAGAYRFSARAKYDSNQAVSSEPAEVSVKAQFPWKLVLAVGVPLGVLTFLFCYLHFGSLGMLPGLFGRRLADAMGNKEAQQARSTYERSRQQAVQHEADGEWDSAETSWKQAQAASWDTAEPQRGLSFAGAMSKAADLSRQVQATNTPEQAQTAKGQCHQASEALKQAEAFADSEDRHRQCKTLSEEIAAKEKTASDVIGQHQMQADCAKAKEAALAAEGGTNWVGALNAWQEAAAGCGQETKIAQGVTFCQAMTNLISVLRIAGTGEVQTIPEADSKLRLCEEAKKQVSTATPLADSEARRRQLDVVNSGIAVLEKAAKSSQERLEKASDCVQQVNMAKNFEQQNGWKEALDCWQKAKGVCVANTEIDAAIDFIKAIQKAERELDQAEQKAASNNSQKDANSAAISLCQSALADLPARGLYSGSPARSGKVEALQTKIEQTSKKANDALTALAQEEQCNDTKKAAQAYEQETNWLAALTQWQSASIKCPNETVRNSITFCQAMTNVSSILRNVGTGVADDAQQATNTLSQCGAALNRLEEVATLASRGARQTAWVSLSNKIVLAKAAANDSLQAIEFVQLARAAEKERHWDDALTNLTRASGLAPKDATIRQSIVFVNDMREGTSALDTHPEVAEAKALDALVHRKGDTNATSLESDATRRIQEIFTTLQGLTATTNLTDWIRLRDQLEAHEGLKEKAEFRGLQEWLNQNNPVKQVEADLFELECRFDVNKKQAPQYPKLKAADAPQKEYWKQRIDALNARLNALQGAHLLTDRDYNSRVTDLRKVNDHWLSWGS